MNKKTKYCHLYPVLLLALVGMMLTSSCTNDGRPDVSHIPSDTRFVRTELDLIESPTKEQTLALANKDSAFYDIYFRDILTLRGTTKDSIILSMQQWMKDSLIADLWSKTKNKYKNINELKSQTDQMFKYLKYYFPNKIKDQPDIYTFISGFDFQLFIFENDNGNDAIGLGLDMFLTPDIHYKMIDPDNTNFSDYITRSWNHDHIVKKIGEIYVHDVLGESPGKRMIDQMIHHGKSLYILSQILPENQDSVIIEYSQKQLEWCQDNELQIWSFFLDNKLFFESNPVIINKYINLSPDSPDMPKDAPGRTGDYMGWQIVKAFMKRYPETTIQELISMVDAQSLLEKSKYKPKRK